MKKESYIISKNELWIIGLAWKFPLSVEKFMESLSEKGLPTIKRAFMQREVSNPIFLETLTEGRVSVTIEQLQAADTSKIKENLELAFQFREPIEKRLAQKKQESQAEMQTVVPTIESVVKKTKSVEQKKEQQPVVFSVDDEITRQWKTVMDYPGIPPADFRNQQNNQKNA